MHWILDMASASIPMSISFIPVGLDALIVWVAPEGLFISTLDLLKQKDPIIWKYIHSEGSHA